MRSVLGLVGATAVAVAAMTIAAAPSKANDSVSLRCSARGPAQIALHALYEERVRSTATRKKFTADFEARAGGAFTPGQHLSVVLGGVGVGVITLAVVVGGEIAGELELDTNKRALPRNFPAVKAGTLVQVKQGTKTVLGCELG